MPNTSCLFGPAFSITGESYYSSTAVNFNVTFDNASDQSLVLAYEWYLDNTLMIGQNIQRLIGQIGCGTHTIGARILSVEGWSGIKNLQFFTCKVPSALQIYGPGSLYEGSSADYYVLQLYTDGTSRDVTAQYTLTSTTGGTFNGNVFTATVDDTSGKSIVVTIGAVKDGVQQAVKQVTIKNVTAIVQVSLLIVGPDSVNEGTSAAYSVISTYSDGSQQDLTAAYSFSATVGTFAGNTLSIPADSIPGNSRGATVSAAKSGTATLSKQITINDAAPVVPVSTVITGPDTVNEGASAAYSVISTYSDGSQQDLTAGYTFSATVGTFAGNVLSVPADGTPGNSRGATVSAAKSGAATLSKQITINDTGAPIEIKDFDYMVVTYKWEVGAGGDLDILVGYENNLTIYDGVYVGYGQASTTVPADKVPAIDAYLWWGLDTTHAPGVEGVLVGMKQFIATAQSSPNIIEIGLYAVWFQQTPLLDTGNFTVELVTYKGGTMILEGTEFKNPTGDVVSRNKVSVQTSKTSTAHSTTTSAKIGTVKYNKTTQTAVIEITNTN